MSSAPPTPTLSLPFPAALLSADDPIAESMMKEAERRLASLKLQRALLSLARIFEEHPAVRFLACEISWDYENYLETDLRCNRGQMTRYIHDDSFSHWLDPDAGSLPDDRLLMERLREWVSSEDEMALIDLDEIRFEREPGARLQDSILRQGLSPEAFAEWELATLAPGPSAALPAAPAPRL